MENMLEDHGNFHASKPNSNCKCQLMRPFPVFHKGRFIHHAFRLYVGLRSPPEFRLGCGKITGYRMQSYQEVQVESRGHERAVSWF